MKGVSELLGQLPGFSYVQLLNDYLHVKRDYADTHSVYLRLYFLQQCSIEPDMSACLCLSRCNRDKVRMGSDMMLRRSLYFLKNLKLKGEEETREVTLQQLLDSAYCLVFYSEYFSGEDAADLQSALKVCHDETRWQAF